MVRAGGTTVRWTGYYQVGPPDRLFATLAALGDIGPGTREIGDQRAGLIGEGDVPARSHRPAAFELGPVHDGRGGEALEGDAAGVEDPPEPIGLLGGGLALAIDGDRLGAPVEARLGREFALQFKQGLGEIAPDQHDLKPQTLTTQKRHSRRLFPLMRLVLRCHQRWHLEGVGRGLGPRAGDPCGVHKQPTRLSLSPHEAYRIIPKT